MEFTEKEIKESQKGWWEDHPDYTRCMLCETVIKKYLTSRGLCPECQQWQRIPNAR